MSRIIATNIRQFLNEQESFDKINFNDNFIKWFGNSKVIDKSGNPMICYHGTPNGGFTEFKPKIGYKGSSKQQVDLGSHFSIEKDYAKGYAGDKKTSKIYETFLRIENPLYTNQLFYREDDEKTFSKYLDFVVKTYKFKINGDFYYDKNGDKQKDVQCILLSNFVIDKIPSNKLYNALLEYGFDGVFHEPYNKVGVSHYNKHPKAYIVLKANQIKSVQNDGSWDIDDDNIYS